MTTATKPQPAKKTKSQAKTAKKDTQRYTVVMLSIAKIHIPSTVRAVSENLNYFIKSIHTLGLLKPVTVKKSAEGYELLSGHNRLEAYKHLGRKTIPARVLEYADQNDLKQKLSMVDENLCHDELTDLEFAESLGQAKAVYEALYPDTKHNASKKKSTSSDPKNGSERKAKRPAFLDHGSNILGRSRSSIAGYCYIFDHLGTAARDLIRTHQVADIYSDLYELAHETADQLALAQILHDHPEYRLADAKQYLAQQRKDATQEDETKSPSDQGTPSPNDSTPAEKPAADEVSAGDINSRTPSHDNENGDSENPDKTSDNTSSVNGKSTEISGLSIRMTSSNGNGQSATDSDSKNSDTETNTTNGASLDEVLADLQQHISAYGRDPKAPHIFSIEIKKIHNELRVSLTSQAPKPEDVLDCPTQCPGWGLYSEDAGVCSTCSHKIRCGEAQTLIDLDAVESW